MTTITDQELRDDPAEILRRAVAGESFDITNQGVVVAELRPPIERSELDRLRAAGQTSPARTPRARAADITPMFFDVTTQEMIDDLRGDR